jgi:hypothetical protein
MLLWLLLLLLLLLLQSRRDVRHSYSRHFGSLRLYLRLFGLMRLCLYLHLPGPVYYVLVRVSVQMSQFQKQPW